MPDPKPSAAPAVTEEMEAMGLRHWRVVDRYLAMRALDPAFVAAREALKPFAESAYALRNCDEDMAVLVPDFISGSDLVVATIDDLRTAAKALKLLNGETE